MRKKCLIVFLLCFPMSFLGAQEWKYFECMKNDDRITLTYRIKKSVTDMETPQKTYPCYIENPKKLVADIKGLLKEVFPSVTDGQKEALKHVSWFLWIDGGSAQCAYADFSFPAEKVDELQRLEPQLFELIERVMEWDFADFDLHYSYPDKKEQSRASCGFPLFWIWK